MTEINYKECARLISGMDNILILSHRNPDGDTLGSGAALCSALRRMGKTACMYPNPQINAKFMPYTEEYLASENFRYEHVIAVDVAVEGLFPMGFSGTAELCIDHHPTNSHYADKLLLKADRSSCGEIVLEVIKNLCGKPDENEATLLYIALTTDCGCFQYGNTSARSLSAGAELIRLGADNHRVSLEFFRKVSRARLMLEGLIYSGMKYYRNGKISIAIVTKEMMERCGAAEEDCEDLAGLAGRAEGSELSITIKETDSGGSKVSVRSGPAVSSSAICAVFGGGGHDMAAGCSLSCEPSRAAEMLLAVIDEVWK